MEPSLNSSSHAVNDADIYVTKHSHDTIACGQLGAVALRTMCLLTLVEVRY